MQLIGSFALVLLMNKKAKRNYDLFNLFEAV